MSSFAFDTLAAARRLKNVGMEEPQAEAIAESLRDAVTGSVATKQDLEAVEAKIREKIATVEWSLKEEIATVERSLKEEIATLKEEIAAIKAGLAALKAEFGMLRLYLAFISAIMLAMMGRLFEII